MYVYADLNILYKWCSDPANRGLPLPVSVSAWNRHKVPFDMSELFLQVTFKSPPPFLIN